MKENGGEKEEELVGWSGPLGNGDTGLWHVLWWELQFHGGVDTSGSVPQFAINLKGEWVPSFVQFLNLGQFLVKTHKVFFFCENLLEKVNTCTKNVACRSAEGACSFLPCYQ